jgi:hypothetical protein
MEDSMQPSNTHVVRFIELGPELNAGAGGFHRRQEAADPGTLARFEGALSRTSSSRHREMLAEGRSASSDADQANDHDFGSPCHNVAPRQNPHWNVATVRQTAEFFHGTAGRESD